MIYTHEFDFLTPIISMSAEKSPPLQFKPKTSVLSPASHRLLKRTIAHSLIAKTSESRPAPKPLPSPPALHFAVKKKSHRELNASAGGARPVPPLQLSFSLHTSTVNSPLTSPRSGETTTSARGNRVGAAGSPGGGEALGVSNLNISLGTPSKQLVLESPRNSELGHCDQPEVVYPITPAQAIKLYHSQLTSYEQGEILEFQQIYYLGLGAPKISGSASIANYGYDDERGDYKITPKDHMTYRYEVLSHLGKGSFGQVCRCYDHKEKEIVAIKIIRNKRRFHQQGVVEVKVLDHLRAHDTDDRMCIVKMRHYFVFRKHLCVTFELLSINLFDFLKNNDFAGLSLNLVRRFAIQLVIALRYIRANHIIHCDLKPENILLKQSNKSGIKVIDFGSACFENERIYTYIQSRYYRAPEIMLGIPYTTEIDMWSLGCILAELYAGKPLFPGETEQDQMMCLLETLGLPPSHLLEQATRKKLFFDTSNAPKIVPNSRGKKRLPGAKTLQTTLKSSDPAFLDFLSQCLVWDPAIRLTPDVALKHQWIVEGINKMQQAAEQSEKRKTSPRDVTLGDSKR